MNNYQMHKHGAEERWCLRKKGRTNQAQNSWCEAEEKARKYEFNLSLSQHNAKHIVNAQYERSVAKSRKSHWWKVLNAKSKILRTRSYCVAQGTMFNVLG